MPLMHVIFLARINDMPRGALRCCLQVPTLPLLYAADLLPLRRVLPAVLLHSDLNTLLQQRFSDVLFHRCATIRCRLAPPPEAQDCSSQQRDHYGTF